MFPSPSKKLSLTSAGNFSPCRPRPTQRSQSETGGACNVGRGTWDGTVPFLPTHPQSEPDAEICPRPPDQSLQMTTDGGLPTTDGKRKARTWEIVACTRQRKLRPVDCSLEKELLAVNTGALANEVNIVSHVETEKKVLGTRQSVPNHQARRSLRQKPLVALGLGDGGPTGADGW